MPLTFVTGPVRSGKSRFAERLASENGGPVLYVATARIDPEDAEWAARIAHHAARRPSSWQTIETAAPGAPALDAVAAEARPGSVLLVDSLGTWLASAMSADVAIDAQALEAGFARVAEALVATRAHAIVVGEEAGWGLVPAFPSGRVFRDVLGRVQQTLAGRADRAFLVVAGFAIDLAVAGRRV